MHDAGEIDVRGCYTAIAVAKMLDIVVPALVHNLADYIVSCQTFEGGIGGEPGAEAHGGYTFCGLAALILIDESHQLDLPSLLDWAVFRQGRVEGGFQGRTNKLVDGCYSFWQGGVFSLIQRLSDVVHQQASRSYAETGHTEIKIRSDGRTEYGKAKKSPPLNSVSEEARVLQESSAQQSDVTETGSECEDFKRTLTAEKIFPFFDCFRKTSVYIETVVEDPAASSKSSTGNMQSSHDFGLSFVEKDIQCGPLFNTYALQGLFIVMLPGSWWR
ncbi:hypothetical protein KI387_002929, partial [Taxus chinensis]